MRKKKQPPIADLVKKFQKKFKDRHDNVSQATLKEGMQKYRDMQEAQKLAMGIPNDNNKFLFGGIDLGNVADTAGTEGGDKGGGFTDLLKNFKEGSNFADASGDSKDGNVGFDGIDRTQTDQLQDSIAKIHPIAGAIRGVQKGLMSVGNMVGGDAGAAFNSIVDPTAGTIQNLKNKDLSVGKKAMSMFIPGAGGVIAKHAAEAAERDAANNRIGGVSSAYRGSQFKYGGKVNKYSGLERFSLLDKSAFPDIFGDVRTPGFNPNNEFKIPNDLVVGNIDSLKRNVPKGLSNKNVQHKITKGTYKKPLFNLDKDKLENLAASAAKFAPLVGNLTNKIDRPTTERGSRLGDRYTKQAFDEARMFKLLNRNNPFAAVKEMSGGDLGMAQRGTQAMGLSQLKAISDTYGSQADRKLSENQFAAQMNRDQNKTNVLLDKDFEDRRARDTGAYNTAKQAKRAAIFEDIGALGKEHQHKQMVAEMFGYKWNGKYMVDKDGKKVSQRKMQNLFDTLYNNRTIEG